MASSLYANGPVDISVGEAIIHLLKVERAIYVIHVLTTAI